MAYDNRSPEEEYPDDEDMDDNPDSQTIQVALPLPNTSPSSQ